MKVQHILKELVYLGYECQTEQSGINNEVEAAVVIQEFSMMSMLKEHKLIILDMKKEEKIASEELLHYLREARCSGVCICCKKLEQGVVDELKRLQIPLFINSREVIWDTFLRVNQLLTDRQNFELVMEECNALNMEILQHGVSEMDGVLNQISTRLENTVLVLDQYFAIRYTEVFPEFMQGNLGREKLNQAISLNPDFAGGENITHIKYGNITMQDKYFSYIVFPMYRMKSRENMGYFVLIATYKPIMQESIWIVKNILPALSSTIFKELSTSLDYQNPYIAFINNVLMKHTTNRRKLRDSCVAIGLEYNENRICFIFEFPELINKSVRERIKKLGEIIDYVKKEMQDFLIGKLYLIPCEHRIIAFHTYEKEVPRITMIASHEDYLAIFTEKLKKDIGVENYIGISETGAGIMTISEQYLEAMESLSYGKRIRSGTVYSYHEEYLFHKLYHHFTKQEMEDIIVNILEPIIQADKEQGNNDLKETLEAYIQCNGNMTQTANRLYIHRNTLNYRMDKIKSLLAIKRISADDFTRYMVALTMTKLIY